MSKTASDGSLNIKIVNGSSYVGAIASDGSLNVVQTDGSTWTGRSHKSGAINVVHEPVGSYTVNNPSGAMNVTDSPYATGMQRVTVVSGTFT